MCNVCVLNALNYRTGTHEILSAPLPPRKKVSRCRRSIAVERTDLKVKRHQAHTIYTLLKMHGVHDPMLDMHCATCCDEHHHVSMCHECDDAVADCMEPDSIICFDPHCTEPPCEQDHMNEALVFGMMPCSCPSTSTAPPSCCTEPSATAAFHDPTGAMSVPCTYEMCTKDASSVYHPPDMSHANTWTQSTYPSKCVSVCDGYVQHAHPCVPLGLNEMDYSQNFFNYCCAPCTHTDPVPCYASCFDVPPSLVSMTPRASTPALRSSETSSVSGTTCSTPMSHQHPSSPEDAQHQLNMLSCQWNGCNFQVPTMQDLSVHMQKAHLPDDDIKLIHDYLSTPLSLVTSEMQSSSNSVPGTSVWPPKTQEHRQHSADVQTAPFGSAEPALKSELDPTHDAGTNVMTSCLCPATSNGSKRHPCGWVHCTESFDTHAELTAHIAEVHVGSGKTEYECGWVGCERARQGRKFQQKQKVLRHIQTHTGDRPYVCSECHKRFSEASTLTQHMRTHTNERPYKCDFPGCNKSFSVIGSLTIHKRTHTGDRPFKCPYPNCSRQFSESSNLNKHLRVHRGEKPFECPECKRRFTRPDQLARHRKIHAKTLTPSSFPEMPRAIHQAPPPPAMESVAGP